MPDNELLRVLRSQPCGLLTDIDGTISPIAPTPDAAHVSPAARNHLRYLAQYLAVVGAISGRGASDAAALVGLPELVYIGNHGMEEWKAGRSEPLAEAQPYVNAIAAVLQEAQVQITLPGVLFENKGVTGSVHYRLTHDPQQAGAEIGKVLETLAARHDLRLTGGRLVWELRPPLTVNKGTAIRRLVAQYNLRGAIFLGDDRTDTDAFVALRELREQGHCATLNIGVLAAETPEIVRQLADIQVDGITGVEQFLSRVVELVSTQQLSQAGG